MIRRLLIAACLGVCAPALAQGPEYRLDASGQWTPAEAKPLDADAQVMASARRALADDRPKDARAILDDWIDKHAASEHPLLPEAYLLRGDARTAAGNEYKALYDYEEVCKRFASTDQFKRAVERELEIGIKYVHGLKRILMGVRWSDATDIGEELLVRVQERLPGDPLAERAGIELADYYYRARELKLAADAYEIFLANFPRSVYAEKARENRIYANIGRFKGPQYDATGLAEAKVLIREFEATDPASARKAGSDALVAKLDESAAAQVLEKARWYIRREDLVSARLCLRRLVRKHPETVAAASGLAMLRERGWDVGENAKAERGEPGATP